MIFIIYKGGKIFRVTNLAYQQNFEDFCKLLGG